MAVLDDTTVAVPALPYRGIQPYRYVDHPIFFEREEETHDLLSLVVVYRGMMLYGDSGAGKSSLINAGLVAGAREKGFQPERIRVYPHDGAELVVERIATTDAGDAFLPSLFALEDDTLPRIVLSTASFEERVHASGPTRPLLVFDQFEELVTLFGASAHADIQRRIVGLLTALLRDASMPVKVLFVFREDYLASVKQLLAAAPELIDQALRLAPPAAEALTTIIRGPFERYPGHFPRELGPEVAERLRAKLADRFGSGEISLSEVQTVCLRLWQSSDPGPLLEARGVQGLLEDYLGEELDAFPPELKYPAVALLSGMVTSAGTRNVISAESLIGHVREEEHEIPEDVLERALDRLESESKLVRRERRRDLYLYEITSEFLVPWINQRRQELIRTRERRRERRRLRLLGAAVVVLLLVVAGVAYLALTAQRSAADARKAEERAKRAAASEASIVLSAAAQQQPDHASDSALLLALAAFEAGKHADASSRAAASREALRTLESVKLSGRLTTLRGHHGQVWSVAFSPDGRTLASGGEDGTLRFWSVRKHQEVGQPQHAATNRVTAGGSPALMSVAYSRNGRVLVTAGNDGTVRFWDARSHKQLPRPIRTSVGFGRTIAFSPDGNTLATAGRDGKLRLWNLRTRRPIRERTLSGPNVLPESIAFSGNGRWLVTAGGGAMELWSVPTLGLIGAIRMGSLGVITVDISADGRTLVTGDARGTVKLWSRRGLRPLGAPLGAPSNQSHSIQLLAVTDVEFSPDGRAVAVAKQDGQIQMWSVSTRRLLHSSFRASTNRVFSISFSRNGRTLASAGGNGLVQLWGLQASAVHGLVIASSRRPFDAAVFSPDGRTIATAGADKTVRLWSTRSPSEIGAPFIGHTRRVWSVAFSPDGETLASAGLDGTIRLWNVRTHQQIGAPMLGHRGNVWTIAFSPDGRTLVSGGRDHTVRLWDVQTHREVGLPLLGHTGQVNGVAFSPDGRLVASGAQDGTVRLWDTTTRLQVGKPLRAPDEGANGVAFSHDGHLLAAAGITNSDLFIWNVKTHRQVARLGGAGGTAFDVDFSPDGRRLASTGDSGAVTISNVRTHRQIGRTMRGHVGWTYTVEFSPDGRALVSAGHDGTVRLWGQSSQLGREALTDIRHMVCGIAERTLTPHEWTRFAPGIPQPKQPVCPARPAG